MCEVPYAKRDAAFKEFLSVFKRAPLQHTVDIMEPAFRAGWAAHKQAMYETMIERVANHVHEARGKRHG
jgi:hypothetical protein